MQNKGAIRLVAVLIAIACIYQLSFTWATRNQEKKAKAYSQRMVELEQNLPSFSLISDLNKAYYLDSLGRAKERFYIDSITAEKVFLGFTYKEIKEKEINLGLDLKGGMNVMLEVSVPELVLALSGNSTNAQFIEAMTLAKSNLSPSRTDFIAIFGEAWEQVAPGQRLSQIFGTYEMRDRIKPETSNADVIEVIREEAEDAISNSFNILRNRIDRFGVTQPNIQRLGQSGRILVELPGVKDPERVRKLLQGTANLEFWETYENSEIAKSLIDANAKLKEINERLAGTFKDTTLTSNDTTLGADSLLLANKDTSKQEESVFDQIEKSDTSKSTDTTATARQKQGEKENPLFMVLMPRVSQDGQWMPGAAIGIAHFKDTAKVNKILAMENIRMVFPANVKFLWSIKPYGKTKEFFELIAIKVTSKDRKAPLTGDVVTNARPEFGEGKSTAEVSMTMNGEGAKSWARLTKENIGKSIAIVLDNYVYSYPTVQGEITGGRSSITGNFEITEAKDLANVLKSGKMPAPARIVSEEVVGPSLGKESINSGIVSFIIAFVLVLIYMMFYYSRAGVVGNIALLTNFFFLFGVLASLGAVLTLPGIAGIVLTMGMAVDANVIIYERIKEELRSGKGIKLAVKEGYKHAMSAIID